MHTLKLNPHWIARKLVCYRLEPRNSYDEECIWFLVQRHGGNMAIYPDYMLFWISPEWQELLMLGWPDLVREQNRDYV